MNRQLYEALTSLGIPVLKKTAVPHSMAPAGGRATAVILNLPSEEDEDALLDAMRIGFDLDDMLVPFHRYTTIRLDYHYPVIWVSGDVHEQDDPPRDPAG